jgi:hypothetical protein
MMLRPEDDRLVDALVERARQGVGLISQEQLDDGWEQLQAPLTAAPLPAPRRPPARAWLLGFATASTLACIALLGYRLLPPAAAPALRYIVEGAAQSSGTAIAAAPGQQASLRFSDDSRVVLASATKLAVTSTDARGASLVLVDGSIEVEVKHRPSTSWQFMAGPFRVKVRGTAFRLGFAAERGYFTLHMTNGLVEVFAPTDRTIAVGAGESLELFAAPPTAPTAAATVSQPAAAAPVAPEREPDSTLPGTAPAGGKGEAARLPARKGNTHSSDRGETGANLAPLAWSELVASGRFSAVVADAEQRGLGVIIARASAAELSSLADAARYTKRSDLARQVLLAVRARFAGSEHARDASFFLGRLAESTTRQSEAALGWYDTYLGEAPRGIYASEALGREMTLLARSAPARARAIANTYLERFPRGPQADLARSLLESSPE